MQSEIQNTAVDTVIQELAKSINANDIDKMMLELKSLQVSDDFFTTDLLESTNYADKIIQYVTNLSTTALQHCTDYTNICEQELNPYYNLKFRDTLIIILQYFPALTDIPFSSTEISKSSYLNLPERYSEILKKHILTNEQLEITDFIQKHCDYLNNQIDYNIAITVSSIKKSEKSKNNLKPQNKESYIEYNENWGGKVGTYKQEKSLEHSTEILEENNSYLDQQSK